MRERETPPVKPAHPQTVLYTPLKTFCNLIGSPATARTEPDEIESYVLLMYDNVILLKIALHFFKTKKIQH